MRTMYYLLLVPLTVLLANCGCTEKGRATFESPADSLWAVRHTDPKEQARRAFQGGDKRFLGVMSVAPSVPGIARADYDKYVLPYGVQMIAGTGDYIADETVRELMRDAPQYAATYNSEILKHITSETQK